MMRAYFQSVVDPPWLQIEPIRIGEVPKTLSTADVFVLVEEDENPLMRIDIYGDCEEPSCFQEVTIWKHYVVMGFSHYVYLIHLKSRKAQAIHLGLYLGYFSEFYLTENFLLAASGERIFCIDEKAKVIWRSDELGIDGVIITNVEDGIIYGEGEWDPPGGWKPFRLRFDSGTLV